MARDNINATLDSARDELFSHIRRCGVLDADEDQRHEWMSDTVEYLSERYPQLSEDELTQLSDIGIRYCQPAIPHGPIAVQIGSATQTVSMAETGPAAEAVPVTDEPEEVNAA